MPPADPMPALRAWAASIPAVRCVAPAFRAWTGVADSTAIAPTKTAHFGDRALVAPAVLGLSLVAHEPHGFIYEAARVPGTHDVVIHVGSEEEETTFTAVVADAPAPPMRVASLASPLRTTDGLGLGSTRAAVEAALGPAHIARRCGYDVVRYEPAQAEASIGEVWFVFRDGKVVAFARYEAV